MNTGKPIYGYRAMAYAMISIGDVKRIDPPQRVPSQLKVLIADGTAINMVVSVKAVPSAGFMPLWNI